MQKSCDTLFYAAFYHGIDYYYDYYWNGVWMTVLRTAGAAWAKPFLYISSHIIFIWRGWVLAGFNLARVCAGVLSTRVVYAWGDSAADTSSKQQVLSLNVNAEWELFGFISSYMVDMEIKKNVVLLWHLLSLANKPKCPWRGIFLKLSLCTKDKAEGY